MSKNDDKMNELARNLTRQMLSKDPNERKNGFIGCLIVIVIFGLVILMISC